MEKEMLDYLKEKTAALIAAPTCCAELRAAAEKWQGAIGTAEEEAARRAYLEEIAADIMPVDGLIAFMESDAGKAALGAEAAAGAARHGRELKAAGRAYCDCPACAACAAILAKKDELL